MCQRGIDGLGGHLTYGHCQTGRGSEYCVAHVIDTFNTGRDDGAYVLASSTCLADEWELRGIVYHSGLNVAKHTVSCAPV